MPRQKRQRLKRRKDGRYCAVYNGKQFMGRTEAEALKAREEYKRNEASGIVKTQTVMEYAEKWLKLHKAGVSEKCFRDYKKQLEALTSRIGQKPLPSVTVDDAATVWEHYAGYSASTIKRARMLFVSLFEAAIENDLCRKNPFKARFAQPPRGKSGSHRALTDDEIRLIISTPHRIQTGVLVMLYAGLRRGEALALTEQDIDLEANTITVNKAIRFDGNKPIITTPKTSAGIRIVPILNALRPFIMNVSGRVLSTVDGRLMSETAFQRAWNSYIHALSVAAGHPINIRPHDLRHTYCTLLADAGVSIKQAMRWMGHSDEKMILHVYDHVNNRRTQNSIEQVEKMLLHMQNHMQEQEGTAKPPDISAAQLDRVSDSDSEGHAFESHRAYHKKTGD